VVWNIFYVSIYWEQSPQLTTDFHIFQRGRSTTNQNISPTFSSSGWIAAIHFDVDPSGLNCFASDSIDSIRSGQLLRGDWKKKHIKYRCPQSPLVGDFPWPTAGGDRTGTQAGTKRQKFDSQFDWDIPKRLGIFRPGTLKKTRNVWGMGMGQVWGIDTTVFGPARKSC
jgi:hypothetical protein